MRQHERYAALQGYTLQAIQGQVEWWSKPDGSPMLYHREKKRWVQAYCAPV